MPAQNNRSDRTYGGHSHINLLYVVYILRRMTYLLMLFIVAQALTLKTVCELVVYD